MTGTAASLSLLDGFDSGEPTKRVEPAIPSSEWSESEMLKNEKDVLGIYVTKHPLTQCGDEMRQYTTVCTDELGDYQDGAEVVLGGIITGMRTVITKQGKNAGSKMGILKIEDLEGSVEAIVFPDQLRDHANDLTQDSIVFLKGKVDRRREEPSLRVYEVVPFKDRFAKLAPDLWLRLNCVAMTDETLDRIHRTLQDNLGDKPIYMEILTTDGLIGTVRSGQRCGVRLSDSLVEQLKQLVGPDSVKTSSLRRRARRNGHGNGRNGNGYGGANGSNGAGNGGQYGARAAAVMEADEEDDQD